METGEEGTPKDKVKISRAQRDIDNLNSPSAPNNANKNNDSIENKVNWFCFVFFPFTNTFGMIM